jgi:hypothetical protein
MFNALLNRGSGGRISSSGGGGLAQSYASIGNRTANKSHNLPAALRKKFGAGENLPIK